MGEAEGDEMTSSGDIFEGVQRRSARFFCENCQSIPASIYSTTVKEQTKTEDSVARIFNLFMSAPAPKTPPLSRDLTIEFLKRGLFRHLPSSYGSLDASRPWICYWILHSLDILGYQCTDEEASKVVHFLNKCKDKKRGGYGGGPGQIAHAAPTYAAVNALCVLGTDEAMQSIDREALVTFFNSLHQPDGSFIMHEDGEVDIRGVYCIASVAKLVNIDTSPSSQLFAGSASWVASCQSYEGGFSAVPFTEAHGGYAFCGWAALNLLDRTYLCETESLLNWLISRQMAFEGGFSGRPNKLVDSCYSFWQLSPLVISQFVMSSQSTSDSATLAALKELNAPLFNPEALTEYILLCCQHYSGGFRDKPGASKDYYHTCYALSGLSLAHNCSSVDQEIQPEFGPLDLEPINPFFNVSQSKAEKFLRYFASLGTVSTN